MTDKVIFLDFDGPLSNGRVTLAYGDDDYMDPVACRALNHICAVSGAKMVCTSTRALDNDFSNFKENIWRFTQGGLDVRHLHPDWTCRDNRGRREPAISDWLSRHPEVKKYVIIDDETVRLPNLVKVDMVSGMALRHFRAVAKKLGFDLIGAFKEARNGVTVQGQFLLPFEHWHEDFNQRLTRKGNEP